MQNRLAALILVSGGLVVAGSLWHWSQPGRVLEQLHWGCVKCHVGVSLEIDGLAASRFSKGTHPIGESKIRPTKGLGERSHFLYSRNQLTSQNCKMCHPDQHQSWLNSAHGRSFRNPIFRHAFERDQLGWCLNCHAPLWEPDKMDASQIAHSPDDSSIYSEGISCVVCHLRDGEIVSNTDYSNKEDQLYHAVRYDPKFGGHEFCAGCHQFNFVRQDRPLAPFVHYESDEHPMQNVVTEYKKSNGSLYANGCLECHFHKKDHSLKSENKVQLKDKLAFALIYKARLQPSAQTSTKKQNPTIQLTTSQNKVDATAELRVPQQSLQRFGKLIFWQEWPYNKSRLTDLTEQSARAILQNLSRAVGLQKQPAEWRSRKVNLQNRDQYPWLLQFQIHIPRIAHHFPTGDLFRILSLYVKDQKNHTMMQYDFRKEVRVVDRQLIQDTTLKPAKNQKGAGRRLFFALPDRPVYCELVYRLQGNIEDEIQSDFENPDVLREVVYKGDCNKKHRTNDFTKQAPSNPTAQGQD